MNSFRQENLNRIKARFQAQTGVALPPARANRRPLRAAVVLAAVIACFTVTALAVSTLFSSLDGDDLGFTSSYEGNGIIKIQVENRSGKELHFQSDLKLKRYAANIEIQPISDNVCFEGTEIRPYSTGVMTIDLSQAYDMEQLEKPLTDDWYYLVLTNNNFAFGQDWMCSVTFAETVWTPAEYAEPEPVDEEVLQSIHENLQFYFEEDTSTVTVERRTELRVLYAEAYTKLFEATNANIVPSVSPCLPGNRIDTSVPYLLVDQSVDGVVFDETVPADKQHLLTTLNYSSVDAKAKLLAAEGEYALVISALLPDTKYGGQGPTVPLIYILTYEKSKIQSDEDVAFVYGQLYSFAELEQYRVYEDGQYVCYEVSGFIYSDLMEYVESCAAEYGNTRFDDQVRTRVQNICDYYRVNLPELFYYKQPAS